MSMRSNPSMKNYCDLTDARFNRYQYKLAVLWTCHFWKFYEMPLVT